MVKKGRNMRVLFWHGFVALGESRGGRRKTGHEWEEIAWPLLRSSLTYWSFFSFFFFIVPFDSDQRFVAEPGNGPLGPLIIINHQHVLFFFLARPSSWKFAPHTHTHTTHTHVPSLRVFFCKEAQTSPGPRKKTPTLFLLILIFFFGALKFPPFLFPHFSSGENWVK